MIGTKTMLCSQVREPILMYFNQSRSNLPTLKMFILWFLRTRELSFNSMKTSLVMLSQQLLLMLSQSMSMTYSIKTPSSCQSSLTRTSLAILLLTKQEAPKLSLFLLFRTSKCLNIFLKEIICKLQFIMIPIM